jgi:type 1 glutamine amidotransferase
VEDRSHPATRHFPLTFTVRDEIYQFRNYSPDKVRVLMRLDEQKIDLQRKGVKRTDGDFGVTWVRNYGTGRIFYSTLGHANEVWDRPDVQKMFVEAVKWVFKITDGDATPRSKPTD